MFMIFVPLSFNNIDSKKIAQMDYSLFPIKTNRLKWHVFWNCTYNTVVFHWRYIRRVEPFCKIFSWLYFHSKSPVVVTQFKFHPLIKTCLFPILMPEWKILELDDKLHINKQTILILLSWTLSSGESNNRHCACFQSCSCIVTLHRRKNTICLVMIITVLV